MSLLYDTEIQFVKPIDEVPGGRPNPWRPALTFADDGE
jgi:hypothetical protein